MTSLLERSMELQTAQLQVQASSRNSTPRTSATGKNLRSPPSRAAASPGRSPRASAVVSPQVQSRWRNPRQPAESKEDDGPDPWGSGDPSGSGMGDDDDGEAEAIAAAFRQRVLLRRGSASHEVDAKQLAKLKKHFGIDEDELMVLYVLS